MIFIIENKIEPRVSIHISFYISVNDILKKEKKINQACAHHLRKDSRTYLLKASIE